MDSFEKTDLFVVRLINCINTRVEAGRPVRTYCSHLGREESIEESCIQCSSERQPMGPAVVLTTDCEQKESKGL